MPRPDDYAPSSMLHRIARYLFGTIASVSVHPRKGDPKWREAAALAAEDVFALLEQA